MAGLHGLSSLTLFRATPAQVLEYRRARYHEWGGILTQEQYLERCNRMDAMDHANNSKLITWVLVPRDNLETLDFESACEMFVPMIIRPRRFQRKGLVRYKSREVQEVSCCLAAHVFTPPHKRGKGYASHMMRLLHWVSTRQTAEHNQFPAEWGAPPHDVDVAGDALFSVLYSGVGDRFYREIGPGIERSGGWETRHPIFTTWEITKQTEVELKTTGSTWKWLKYEDLESFWEKDAQFIRRAMDTFPESQPHYHSERPNAFVTCLPDQGVGSYSPFYFMSTLDSIVSMDVYGIEKTDNSDRPTFATWIVDTTTLPPVLVITRLSATEADFPELIYIIQDVGRKAGVRRMEAWNIPPNLLEGVLRTGGKTFQRRGRLPALKWYGEGDAAAVEWVFNERFSWS